MSDKRSKKLRKRKARKLRQEAKSDKRKSPRQCSDCGECCVAFAVIGLPGHEKVKPAGTPCMHLVDTPGARCGLYGKERPDVCGAYKCMWLHDGDQKNRVFSAEERPDKIGLIFDLTPADHPATKALKRPAMIARPTRSGALKELGAQKTIAKFVRRGHVVVLFRNGGYEFVAADHRDAQKVAKAYQQLPNFRVLPTLGS